MIGTVGTRSRALDRGTERGRRMRMSIGGEIRDARVNRNLTLRDVGLGPSGRDPGAKAGSYSR